MVSPFAVPLLRRGDLADQGIGAHALDRMLASSELKRVRPGVYVRVEDVRMLTPEGRIVVRARALSAVSRATPVFSHLTAAAILGLPVYGWRTVTLDAILSPERPGAATGVVRHRGELTASDVVGVGDLSCTSLVRTAADIARTAGFTPAVCAIDAALRQVAHPTPGTYLTGRAEEFRETAREVVRRSAHGRARAHRTLAFADGRAQLPGESVSRVLLAELGFARPSLQVRIEGPRGEDYFVDIGLDDVSSFCEFDGESKYTDEALRSGRTIEQVLLAEKQREDWIRGRTQRRFARWGWAHIRSARDLGARLGSFGITPPR